MLTHPWLNLPSVQPLLLTYYFIFMIFSGFPKYWLALFQGTSLILLRSIRAITIFYGFILKNIKFFEQHIYSVPASTCYADDSASCLHPTASVELTAHLRFYAVPVHHLLLAHCLIYAIVAAYCSVTVYNKHQYQNSYSITNKYGIRREQGCYLQTNGKDDSKKQSILWRL